MSTDDFARLTALMGELRDAGYEIPTDLDYRRVHLAAVSGRLPGAFQRHQIWQFRKDQREKIAQVLGLKHRAA